MRVTVCPGCGHRSAGMEVCPRCEALLPGATRQPAESPSDQVTEPPRAVADRVDRGEPAQAPLPAATPRRDETAAGLGRFVVVVGWIAVALGVATALAIIGSGFSVLGRAGVAIILPAVILPIGGLLLVVAGQILQILVEARRDQAELRALLGAGGRPGERRQDTGMAA